MDCRRSIGLQSSETRQKGEFMLLVFVFIKYILVVKLFDLGNFAFHSFI